MAENKKKFDFISKMTLIGIIAVTLLILIVTIVSCSGGSKPKVIEEIIIPVEEETVAVVDTPEAYDRAIAVVKYVDVNANSLMVYDIEKLKTITLEMDSAIEIKDAYGTDIALSQIKLGDMVETKYDINSKRPEYVKITAVTWERKDVSNMVVDIENMTIKIANETYGFTDELITSDAGVPFDILELSTADEAVVRGYKNQVWSIVLLNGHGTITLSNHSGFVGGNIEISNRINIAVESVMTVPVSAGTHNVVISKDGMAPFVTQVMVIEGEDVIIDLSEAQPKIGTIEFIVIQDDVSLYLDDELLDLSVEIKLDFGTYKIRAEKEGFAPWENELIVKQAYIQYTIDLEKAPFILHIQGQNGAELYVEGVLMGTIPIDITYLPGNIDTIIVRQDGFYNFKQDFAWSGEGDQYITLPDLKPIPDDEDETPTDDIYKSNTSE